MVQQSQQGATRIAADQAVDVTSTHASVKAGSPSKVLLTAGGAGISISGGNITLTAPGNIYFKAAMKNLAGGAGASDSVALKKAGKLDLYDECFEVKDQATGEPLPYFKYRIETKSGELLARGVTDAQGKTARVRTAGGKEIRILADD